MTNLGGHDLECLIQAFSSVQSDRSQCFIAYTIKGYTLPFAGHQDNHSGLMTMAQMVALQQALGIAKGAKWEPFAGLGEREDQVVRYVRTRPLARCQRYHQAPRLQLDGRVATPAGKNMSTQEAFGRIMTELSRVEPQLAELIVTTSPDVMMSTNLGGSVNRRKTFSIRARHDAFKELGFAAIQRWSSSPGGQHIELGIAENNLFPMLAALGLSAPLFEVELFPIGTIYDTFIPRGLDALNYACYQDSRFILIGTPSGITLAPEGGAHQSITTPLLGIGQPQLVSFEPAYADELAAIMQWSLRQLPPAQGAEFAIVCCGAVISEAMEAYEAMREEVEGMGVAVVTSADRLYADWNTRNALPGGQTRVEMLLAPLSMRGLSRLSTAIHWGCRGWAACAASGSGPWELCALANVETFPTFTASIASMPRQ